MTVRVGFLGGGFIAHYHGKMLHTSGVDAEIAFVHDPDPAHAETFASASGARIARSEDELLSSVDAVYVCTWTAEHPRLVAEVAARGLPVFCEKPLAVDLETARGMVDAVERAGVVNQVGLVLRDSPDFRLLHHLVDQPDSGRPMSVVFRDDQYIPIQGQYGSTWRADPTRAGSGALLEHSIHDVDILEWLLGPITSVSATSSEFHAIAGIEDAVSATLRFGNEAVGSLVSIWHDLLERPSLRRVEVFCERAYYWIDDDDPALVRWTRPDGSGAVELGDLDRALADAGIELRNPDRAFIEAAAAGAPATPDFATALRAHVVTDALYRSAAAGGATIEVGSPA
ncbi:MAG TPA: Gfo/Idh/MocA family oxidoreductase [Acidimicrobiales bacterium]|nr:Gfo/Idh/MocA family oxidoreductase [Acidimicrobiales bacterium]